MKNRRPSGKHEADDEIRSRHKDQTSKPEQRWGGPNAETGGTWRQDRRQFASAREWNPELELGSPTARYGAKSRVERHGPALAEENRTAPSPKHRAANTGRPCACSQRPAERETSRRPDARSRRKRSRPRTKNSTSARNQVQDRTERTWLRTREIGPAPCSRSRRQAKTEQHTRSRRRSEQNQW
jgi:hypothetical protein